MSYVRTDGRYVYTEQAPSLPSAARTASGAGTAVDSGAANVVRGLTLAVTASSGTTPTLDARLETSHDNAAWVTVGSFAQKTGAASETKLFSGLDRYVRVAWTVGGTTPSFTFSVSGGELV